MVTLKYKEQGHQGVGDVIKQMVFSRAITSSMLMTILVEGLGVNPETELPGSEEYEFKWREDEK